MRRGDPPGWRNTRATIAHHLATTGPLPCIRGGQPIHHTDAWDLGHITDHALGGTDHPSNLGPEHRHPTPGCCPGNRANGTALARTITNLRRLTSTTTNRAPSRTW